MKKLVLLFGLFVTVNSMVLAQSLKLGLSTDLSSKSMDMTTYTLKHNAGRSFTYGATFHLSYEFHNKMNIHTGLGFEQNRFNFEHDLNPSDSNDPLLPIESTVKISYLNIPIQIGYRISLSDKLALSPSLGMNFGLRLNNSEEVTHASNNTSETELVFTNLNNILYTVIVDFSFDYQLTEKTSIYLTPYLGNSINKIDDVNADNTFFQYGGRLGIYVNI